MKKINIKNYTIGDAIPELTIGPISQVDLVRYAGASGDFNPIHTDTEFALKVGLGGTIVHGMYLMAVLGRLATNFFHPLQIESFGSRFRGVTRPGEQIRCRGVVKKIDSDSGRMVIELSAAAVGSDTDEGELRASAELVVVESK